MPSSSALLPQKMHYDYHPINVASFLQFKVFKLSDQQPVMTDTYLRPKIPEDEQATICAGCNSAAHKWFECSRFPHCLRWGFKGHYVSGCIYDCSQHDGAAEIAEKEADRRLATTESILAPT
jgi:hypothetical protein